MKPLPEKLAKEFSQSTLRAEVVLESEAEEAKRPKKKKKNPEGLGLGGALSQSRKRFRPATDFVAAQTTSRAKRLRKGAPQQEGSILKIRKGMLSAGLQKRFDYLCTG